MTRHTAQKGDIIKCKGRTVVIDEVYESYYDDIDGWMIEGKDHNGRYFMWKQFADGGEYKEGEQK